MRGIPAMDRVFTLEGDQEGLRKKPSRIVPRGLLCLEGEEDDSGILGFTPSCLLELINTVNAPGLNFLEISFRIFFHG